MTRLFGQGDEVALQTLDLNGGFLLGVNLVEVGANPQKDAPRTHWRQTTLVKTLPQLDDVLDAIGFGQEASAVEGIDVQLGTGGLVTAKKMPRQTDPNYRQPETAR